MLDATPPPPSKYRPVLSQAQAPLTLQTQVMDEQGEWRTQSLACERPLTIYLNKREILTLMTLGEDPEALVLGYLRNQGWIHALEEVIAIQVDWEVAAAAVVTQPLQVDLDERLSQRTVTTGCGQGTVFGNQMERLQQLQLAPWPLKQSEIYHLLDQLSQRNATYRQAGAVHGCALCQANGEVLAFCEDIGRHNAVDTLAGRLWLDDLPEQDLIFYTTGRLTSEMVIKAAQMQISVLISRSGATQMGLELAQRLGLLMLARAKGKHFLVYSGQERLLLDAKPQRLEVSAKKEHRHD
ncbi:formate dehydrogenase accessory sulfurtransferase FdhD [Nitrincola tapanii]|uniref:Sulfur carrier protein FdhD n=1 Tax=Nitrincola tapanii TaxID=1708751 RepID=A0A5A9W3J7_9GAMM|nr:formate dehydrogenase accessory sulfurtransferase FdhD [Nitrincola tapanii]KAA0875064.1 sulfurtransferase FdhD [Nitrincola tapanii]